MATQDDLSVKMSTGDALCTKYGLNKPKKELAEWPNAEQKFVQSEEVEEMAQSLIDKFKMDSFVSNINMGYVFRIAATKSAGEIILGTVKTEPDIERTLHGFDALMIIGYDTWQDLDLDQKYRLIYSKLVQVHFDTEKGKITILQPPAAEFPEVMLKFGPAGDAQVQLLASYEQFKKDHTRK